MNMGSRVETQTQIRVSLNRILFRLYETSKVNGDNTLLVTISILWTSLTCNCLTFYWKCMND